MSDRMTPAEAVMLCRFAKACCPQQAFDEYTPDAWFELLRDIPFMDCKDAVIEIVRSQPFVAPSEIRKRIDLVRIHRLEKFGHVTPPPGLTWQQEVEYIRGVERRAASGELTREQYDADERAAGRLGDRELPALEGVFRRVD